MELDEMLDDRGTLARLLLAAVLAVVAISSIRSGKRLRGVLAGLGAVALGYTATAEQEELFESIDVVETGTTSDDDYQLHCAACGDPIVPGQRRVPGESGGTVHEDCAESLE